MKTPKTIAGKLIAALVSVFKDNFSGFIKTTYEKIQPDLRDEISLIVKVVNHVNDFIDSPIADVVVAIIPGDKDNKVLEWLRSLDLNLSKELSGGDKALLAANLTKDYTGMELAQALITTQVVYKAEIDK